MQHDVSFRPFTQDLQVLFEVLEHNAYCVEPITDDGLILDLGAHIGAFALCCVNQGARNVVCYEPDQDCFDLLTRNTGPWHHHVDVHRYAVYGQSVTCHLQQVSVDQSASAHILSGSGEEIQAISIRHLLERHSKIKLLKLSVNGSEKSILDADSNWDGVEAVCGEVYFRMAAAKNTRPTDAWLTKRLYQLGFPKHAVVHDRRDPALKAKFWGRRR